MAQELPVGIVTVIPVLIVTGPVDEAFWPVEIV